MSECIVKIPVFEGPLDLLLHLVRKNKLDIFDLPISLITEQYLAYLEMMQALDLDIAGEYLLMASTLLYIKSQMLLPAEEVEAPAERPDPRQEIVAPLLELAKFQRAAEFLSAKPILGRDIFVPPGEDPTPHEGFSVSLFELLSALRDVLSRKPPSPLEVSRSKILVTEMMDFILKRLAREKVLRFRSFLEDFSREEVIACFLALLELALRGQIRLIQHHPFEEIEIITR